MSKLSQAVWVLGAVFCGVVTVVACGSESGEEAPTGGDGGPDGGDSLGAFGGRGEVDLGDGGTVTVFGDGGLNTYDPSNPGACVPLVIADKGGNAYTPLCANCKDDDGDGRVDWQDPECSGPLDNDEATFATGIPGDNVDLCKQDCFFDGNSGAGDDRCNWDLHCDPAYAKCTPKKSADSKQCESAQPQACIDVCRRLTPNGCDCFGCCDVYRADGSAKTVRLDPTCTAADVDDPAKCSACTKVDTCANDCAPCELCIGKTTLPIACKPAGDGGIGAPSGQVCSDGTPVCNEATPCASGSFCLTGCCVKLIAK